MLTHFKISFSVLHDIDSPRTRDGVKKNSAYTVNKKISDAIDAARQKGLPVVYRCSCPNFEQHHGMDLPSKDKPYESWKAVRDNDGVRTSVRQVLDALMDAKVNNHDANPIDGKNYEPLLKEWIATNKIDTPAFKFV